MIEIIKITESNESITETKKTFWSNKEIQIHHKADQRKLVEFKRDGNTYWKLVDNLEELNT